MDDRFKPLEPLKLLPRDQWKLRRGNDTHFGVGIFTRGGTLYIQKWSIHDFPNDFFSIEDLERFGVYLIYVTAIEKLQDG